MIKLFKNRKGAALVEYGLLVAGVAVISTAAVSVLGHKTSDLVSAVATLLPGAHEDDNGPIASGKLVETTAATVGGDPIAVDTAGIAANTATARLGNNLGADNLGTDLVVEAN